MASVYFATHIDSGVDNCIISSKKGSARAGVMYVGLAYGSITGNTITNCTSAVSIQNSGMITVTDNVFENNVGSDVLIRSSREIFIARNNFKTVNSFAPIRGEKENHQLTVAENIFAHASYDIAEALGNGDSRIIEDNVFNG